MKKIVSVVMLVVLCVLPFSCTSYALPHEASNAYTEYFDDGSYAVITIVSNEEVGIPKATAQTKSGSKSYDYYDSNNVKLWQLVLNGTFTYNGSTSSCTSSSVSYSIYDNAWRVTSAVASKSGNRAIGDFTVKRYFGFIPTKTVTKQLVLTCSASGVLS